jgi:soluble lytic murein transglycosylase-like protein
LGAPSSSLAAQIHQESGWKPQAKSWAGAEGLSQFMPSTAKWWGGLHPEFGPVLPRNPTWALRAHASYMRWLWDQMSAANDCERFAKTLSSYNGGAGWISRDEKLARNSGLDSTYWFDHVEQVNSGRKPSAFTENRGYPRRILYVLEPIYQRGGWGIAICEKLKR